MSTTPQIVNDPETKDEQLASAQTASILALMVSIKLFELNHGPLLKTTTISLLFPLLPLYCFSISRTATKREIRYKKSALRFSPLFC
ncbi:hypothetical protein V6N11_041718 [Hibiscus sabdariffa]|uniref:Uncharacterized protein n=1 Tax=Hibiscus sabdariffa TaxID=183260 RepID=A0ABR2RLQ4_9ROSI